MPIATPPSESIDVLVMLALLVVGPLIGAVLSTCVATGSRRWVSAAALLLVLAMSAGVTGRSAGYSPNRSVEPYV